MRLYAGGSYGSVLWRGCVPSEQLEHPGRAAGVCVDGGHPGVHRIRGWESDLRHPSGPSPAPHTSTTQVQIQKITLVCVCSTHIVLFNLWVCVFVLQGDKSGSRSKTGGRNSDHISQTNWEYCSNLLCFFHCVWNSGSSGKHLCRPFPVRPLLVKDKLHRFSAVTAKYTLYSFSFDLM